MRWFWCFSFGHFLPVVLTLLLENKIIFQALLWLLSIKYETYF